MMSRKNFISLAQALKQFNRSISPGYEFTQEQIEFLADWCELQNKAFDRTRWLRFMENIYNDDPKSLR